MSNSSTIDDFSSPTTTIESTHLSVMAFSKHHCVGATSAVEQAIQLYYAIRDEIRYDPYRIDLTIGGMRASNTLLTQRGWCVSKAILMAASCRSLGIPSRLGFADVRNHLSTPQLRQRMGTDVFFWHGYTEMFLAGVWVKATPSFSRRLCQRLNLLPLEFDGVHDSIYQAFDAAGHQHMEYLNYRGVYADLPLAEIRETFDREYRFSEQIARAAVMDFDQDISADLLTGK
jgi:transglutaminase-like putative cysteine protease